MQISITVRVKKVGKDEVGHATDVNGLPIDSWVVVEYSPSASEINSGSYVKLAGKK